MSILEIITDPTATQTVAVIRAIKPTGILDIINQQTDAGAVTWKNIISLGISVVAGWMILRSGFAWGKLWTVGLVAGITFFFMNGGMVWLGDQFKGQVSASAVVQVDSRPLAGESFLDGRLDL